MVSREEFGVICDSLFDGLKFGLGTKKRGSGRGREAGRQRGREAERQRGREAERQRGRGGGGGGVGRQAVS
jgi:hypothetical protein